MFIYGRIKNGVIQLQRFYQQEIGKWEGKQVEIKVFDDNRTQQQNRYMWGVVYKLIGLELGYEVEEVHQVFKKRFLTYEKNGHKFQRSTSDLSKQDFKEYLDKVIRYATSELGIIIPDPDIEYEETYTKLESRDK